MSVRRNVIASGVSSGWTALVHLLMVPVYLRYLGIEAFGLVSFFVTLQAWLAVLDLGLSPTLNREMARWQAGLHTPEGIRDLLTSMEFVYGGMAVVLGAAVGLGSSWVTTEWLQLQALAPATAAKALALMGLVIGVQWVGTLYRSALLGLQEHVWLGKLTVVLVTGRALGTWGTLAFVAPDVVAFVLVQCMISAIEAGMLAVHVRRRLPTATRRGRFSLDALRGVWRFAAELSAIAVLATLLTQVDKLLLAALLPLEEFGYFSLAVAVAGALSVVIVPVHNAAYPRLAQLAAGSDRFALATEYHRLAQLLSIVLLPCALVLAVFARELVLLWTDDKATAEHVAPVLTLWAVGTALNGVMHLPYAAQLAHGWPRLALLVNAAAVAILIPATLYWVPREGAIAAAWIWVVINASYLAFSVPVMHMRILQAEKWKWYLQDLLAPLLPAALAVAVSAILHRQIQPLSPAGGVVFMATTVLVACLAAAAATATGHEVLRTLLGRTFPRIFRDERP